MILNAETLRRLVALYARWVRLTELKKPTKATKAEAFMLRMELEDMGFTVAPHEPPNAAA